eukprot:5451413-Pyramimonas_sp.AAC.1
MQGLSVAILAPFGNPLGLSLRNVHGLLGPVRRRLGPSRRPREGGSRCRGKGSRPRRRRGSMQLPR